MIKKIDGKVYIDLLNHGIKNIEKHKTTLNDLNVFPVPDGDTGTNMLMTLRYGYQSLVKDKLKSISEASSQFASSAVFGARGNSGVITSQFFKGMAAALKNAEEADPTLFAEALRKGCEDAYSAVMNPVEGTMLTVLKDASAAVTHALPLNSINDVIDIYLDKARASLKNTPELLPILKKANVVDSGGCGVVVLFEGMQKFLKGEEIDLPSGAENEEKSKESDAIDLSLFDRETSFDYGYCIEGLIQLKINDEDFSHTDFKETLSGLGTSLVTSLEGDKVKIHIHSQFPGNIISYCQKFGEFLTIKIENMTVQNMSGEAGKEKPQKFLCSDEPSTAEFAIVAVASTEIMQKKFFEMGADVVILSSIAPSSKDFMDAFKHTSAKQILVFPNSSNSILTSMQAGSLYKNAKVTVLNSRSVAECYAALSILDFEGTIDDAVTLANDTIANIRQVFLYHANNSMKYGSKVISKNDFFALEGKKVLAVDVSLEQVALKSVKKLLAERDTAVISIFYGKRVSSDYVSHLAEEISDLDRFVEIATISTMDTSYDITMIFE